MELYQATTSDEKLRGSVQLAILTVRNSANVQVSSVRSRAVHSAICKYATNKNSVSS